MGKPVLTARQLPEIRAELAQWLDDDSPHGGPATWARGFDPATAASERAAAHDWATALRAADLFCVSTDMTRLAVSAGLALPAYRLHAEDLPAPHGLLLWEEPVTGTYESDETTGCPIIAVTWAVHGGAVHVRTWAGREDWLAFMAQGNPDGGVRPLTGEEVRVQRMRHPQALVCMASSRLPFGHVPGWLATTPEDTSTMTVAELEDHTRSSDRQEQAERALVVTWLLMGQTLSREERQEAPRSAVRHIRRLDPNLLTAVRYVQLRHRGVPRQDDGPGEDAGRGYRHRWIVRGHWRQHWYPSRGAHRPIWIDSHVKGPDGAPLLDPGKLVHVLRR